jgi:hypothetical protein
MLLLSRPQNREEEGNKKRDLEATRRGIGAFWALMAMEPVPFQISGYLRYALVGLPPHHERHPQNLP